jgi:hypothetical protein
MKTGPLITWFNESVVPMLDAYYAGDIEQARQAHAAAEASLESDPELDSSKAKWMRLSAAWVTVLMEYGEQDEGRQVLAQLMLAWAGPQPGLLSAEVARVTELMTRLHHDNRGWLPLFEPEARAMIAAVPDPVRGGNFWNAVGIWAFKHRERELLELALAHFSTDPPLKLQEWQYYSLRLMYRLLEQIALSRDVEQVIDAVGGKPQLHDFQLLILPECRRQGILSPLAEATLQGKLQQFAA